MGVGALCLSLFHSAQALAKPAGFFVTLQYEAAPSCPGTEALKAVVAARLGYDPFADDAPNRVLFRIAPKASSLNGRIEWRDAEGRWAGDQTFSMASGDCLRLTRTMGLALAVQIQLLREASTAPAVDPERLLETEPAAKAPAEAPNAKPAGPNAKPAGPNAKPAGEGVPSTLEDEPQGGSSIVGAPGPNSHRVFEIGAGSAVGFGMAPHPILLGRIFGRIAWQHSSIQLSAQVSLPATARRADGAGVSEQLLLLGAAGCESLERWSACLLVNAGRVSMAGQDIDHPTSTRLPYVDVGLRAGFSQPLGARVVMNVHADGLVVLTRWTASLDEIPVWTMPRFAAAVGIDIGVQFR
jgi:hypothetical protein